MSETQQTTQTQQQARVATDSNGNNGSDAERQLTTAAANDIQTTDASYEDEDSSGFSFTRFVGIAAVGMIVFIVVVFVIGLIFILTDPAGWQPRVAVIRDLALIIVSVQSVIIVTGLAVMLVQLARFINLLGSEVKPITRDAREALKSVRTTADFTRKNVAAPLIQTQTFFAGLGVFIREILRLTRLISRRSDNDA